MRVFYFLVKIGEGFEDFEIVVYEYYCICGDLI